jgi:hypothetical protein
MQMAEQREAKRVQAVEQKLKRDQRRALALQIETKQAQKMQA